MMAKRILFCIPTLEGGGAERQLSYICRPIMDMGWDVHIAVLRLGSNYKRIYNSGAKIHCIPYRSHYDPTIVLSLYRLIKKINPAIVQTRVPLMDIFGGIAARLSKKPWVLSERTSAMGYNDFWLSSLRNLVAAKAAGIIANSSCGIDYWETKVPECIPRQVIRNAVPLEEIQSIESINKEMFGINPKQKLILCAGRLAEEKNIDNLILGLREVLSKANAIAILCGEGPLRLHAQELLEKYSIHGRVRMPGYVDNIWAWMKAADVFVSVSFFEGMSNTVAEAMACGCPLVISDIPAHREMLNEESALLVDPHRPDLIANAILKNLQPAQEVTSRVQCARKIVSVWSIQTMAQEYQKVYQTILEKQRNKGSS